jgi:hypothetical protein
MEFRSETTPKSTVHGSGKYIAGLRPTWIAESGADFDPVWAGDSIFHDVFEESHGEPHFEGALTFNLGAEMAAMGALYYYQQDLGVQRFRGQYADVDAATAVLGNTRDLLLNAWTFGMQAVMPRSICSDYGVLLRSEVPDQPPVDPPSLLDSVVEEYWNGVEAYLRSTKAPPASESVTLFRESVTRERIFNLHRWGWHEARRKVPFLPANRDACNRFIDFWTDFCQTHDAEELMQAYKGILFNVEHEGGSIRIDSDWIDTAGDAHPVPGWSN